MTARRKRRNEMNTAARTTLDTTFAAAVLVAGLVFGVLPATSSVEAVEAKAAPAAEVTLTADGRMKMTVTAERPA
jgi:hypothetical protein